MKSKLSHINRCELTDRYEVAIMHRTVLHIRWECQGEVLDQPLVPMNLCCENGQEYLYAEKTGGAPLKIGLDQILDVQEFSS